jgi:hypothetical protein
MKWTVTYEVDIPGSRLKELTADDLDCTVTFDVKAPMGYCDVRFVSAVPVGTTAIKVQRVPADLEMHHTRVQSAFEHLLWEAQESPVWQANIRQWMQDAEDDRKAGRRYRGIQVGVTR